MGVSLRREVAGGASVGRPDGVKVGNGVGAMGVTGEQAAKHNHTVINRPIVFSMGFSISLTPVNALPHLPIPFPGIGDGLTAGAGDAAK